MIHGDLGAGSEKMRHAAEDRGVRGVGLARLVGVSRLDEILKGYFYRATVVETDHVLEGWRGWRPRRRLTRKQEGRSSRYLGVPAHYRGRWRPECLEGMVQEPDQFGCGRGRTQAPLHI